MSDAAKGGHSRTEQQMRVFVSYSRRDERFVQHLAGTLESHGYAVDFDQSERDATGLEFGISAQDRWWLRLKEMIAEADVMVFVVSPESAASRVCDDEIAHAHSLGKRLVPILRRTIDFDRAPERLRALNIKLSFESDDPERLAQSTERLRAELALDLDWHRRATRLARLAQQWDADGRPQGQLLREGAIAEADAWAARRPSSAPTPGPLLLEFLVASREKEEQDRVHLQTSELNARLKACDALFERALVHLQRAAYRSACECLLEAAALAPPDAIPAGFRPTLAREGWARKAWTVAACIAGTLPVRIDTYSGVTSFRFRGRQYAWFDRGKHWLNADHRKVQLVALSDARAVPVLSPEFTGTVIDAAGAARAPRACVLTADGWLHTFDLQAGSRERARVPLRQNDENPVAAVSVDASGQSVLVARIATAADEIVVDVFTWGQLNSVPQCSIVVPEERPRIRWAGFSLDAATFAVLSDGGLSTFDRHGKKVENLPGATWRGSGVSADLSAFATPQYDLVQLRRRRVDRWTTPGKAETSTDTLVLHGATSLIDDVVVTPGAAAILAVDLRGNVLEWRPRPEVERGSTTGGVNITQSFGSSNRLDPSNRLEGLPDCVGIALHPDQPHDVLVVAGDAVEHWRLVDPVEPCETLPSLPPSMRVVTDSTTGIVAAATEAGVWIRHLEAAHTEGRTIGLASVVWDVALAGDRVAATYGDGSVRIWTVADGREVEAIDVDGRALSVVFSRDGARLFIGAANGVLWERSSGRLVRIAALGVGPIIRLRMSTDERIGVAAGRTPDDIDLMHGGVAAWSPEQRRLLWTTQPHALHPYDVDISPDSAILFVADSRGALALAPDTGEVLARLRPPQTDPSKPAHVTAICCGPDGRTAFLGLWDGSMVHIDPLSQQVISQVKAHAKFVTSIASDTARGLLVSTSHFTHGNRLAVWRGWSPEFFERPASAERIAAVREIVEARYGTVVRAGRTDETALPLAIAPAAADDAVAEARAVREYDEMRAADLLVQAAASGRVGDLSPDERRLAGQVLLSSDETSGMKLLQDAATAGSMEAHVALGVHLLGKPITEAGWTRALPHFRAAADGGAAHGAYLVGYYHDHIDGGFVAAVNWRSIAAPTGAPAGLDSRRRLAREWYERAARGGSVPARERLAEMTRDN